MPRHFYSIYGPLITEFLTLKRSLGFKYQSGEYELSKLDKIAYKREENFIGITKELADAVGAKGLNESDKSRANRVQILRQFAFFLNDTGHPSYIPNLPSFKSVYTPYIFDQQEVLRIFSVCDGLKIPHRSPNTAMLFLPVLIRLLYTTGIRLGEAMSLAISDVDIVGGHLKVRDSKNGKQRLIPFTSSMAEALKDYLKYRSQRPVIKSVDHLFVRPDGSIPSYYNPYKWFRKILYRAGISHGGRKAGPRLHDLRHTFAVHSLAALSKKGIDLYYSLPILSTYLGHQSLSATDKYVRLTQEMYPSLIESVNKICPHLFPEINKTSDNETD